MLSDDRDGWSPLELSPALLPLEKETAAIPQQVSTQKVVST